MQMPLRGSSRALHFKGDPHELQQYFEDVELLCEDTQLFADEDRIQWAIRYARREDAELWSTLPSRVGADWSAFKAEVTCFYPGAEEDDRKYLRTDLIRLVEAQAAGTMTSRRDLGEYVRKFTLIASFLEKKGRLSKGEREYKFVEGFPAVFRAQLIARLSLAYLDHYPKDPWPTDHVIQHASFLLTGSSTSSYAPSPTASPLPPRTPAAFPTPSHEPLHTPAPPIPSVSHEAMFLGLAEEVSHSEDELDEEDRAALVHAYAQIEEVQCMIEVKRLACVLPRALPVLKLWVDEEALDLAEESACTHDAGKPTLIENADIVTRATDSDALLVPTLQCTPPALEHPAVPPGLGLEQYHAHVEQGSISEKSADVPFDLDVLLLQPGPCVPLLLTLGSDDEDLLIECSTPASHEHEEPIEEILRDHTFAPGAFVLARNHQTDETRTETKPRFWEPMVVISCAKNGDYRLVGINGAVALKLFPPPHIIAFYPSARQRTLLEQLTGFFETDVSHLMGEPPPCASTPNPPFLSHSPCLY